MNAARDADHGNRGERQCSSCKEWLLREAFSKRQWTLSASDRRCATCLSNDPSVCARREKALQPTQQLSQVSREVLDVSEPPQSDDDNMSVATSAVTIESTQHLRQREEQRGIDRRELQQAVKHGNRVVDRATGNIHFHYNGVCYVTDATAKVGITSWVEDGAQADRPATIIFMQCDGRLKKTQCKAHDKGAAMAAATKLLQGQVQGGARPPFELLVLKTREPLSTSGADPSEELVMVLQAEVPHGSLQILSISFQSKVVILSTSSRVVVTSMARDLQSWFASLCGTTDKLTMSMFCSSPAMGLSLGSDSMTSCLVCGSFGSSGGCARFLLGVLQPSAAEAIGACWSCAACGARDCVFWPFAVFGVVAVTFGPLLTLSGRSP